MKDYLKTIQKTNKALPFLEQIMRQLQEAEGVCTLRRALLGPPIFHALCSQVGLCVSKPISPDAWLEDSLSMRPFYLRWKTLAQTDVLWRAWETLADYTYVRGRRAGAYFERPHRHAGPESIDVFRGYEAGVRGAANEVVECAIQASMLAQGCRMALDSGELGTSGADYEDHVAARKKLIALQSILRETVSHAVLRLANKVWHLDTSQDPLGV